MFNFSDESSKQRLMREYHEDTPMGAPCKSDFADDFQAKLDGLENNGTDLSELSLDQAKTVESPTKGWFNFN
jgi:hypothetical protein